MSQHSGADQDKGCYLIAAYILLVPLAPNTRVLLETPPMPSYSPNDVRLIARILNIAGVPFITACALYIEKG